MSLPPGFLDELRTRVSLASVAGRKLSWDRRKSNTGKGDYWACCPFHQEKSSSFHLDDQKGFYYCFGCHAKGDAITFVQETENLPFIEAVELLAREVGMTMPERDPRAAAREDERAGLAEVMEIAAAFYRARLSDGRAQAARTYLQGRGVSAETLRGFGIGFASDARNGLYEYLRQKGVDPQVMDRAGLISIPEGGGAPYDRFRGRIIFPIRDARGRCIAFGGRAMEANARAKYLNSPETELFHKGRTLYNIGPAREAAGKVREVIAAEGYMDVIALSQAGFAHACAPLGTAVTEDQLRLLWRMADEPVLALDGDAAGLRAAMRVIDLALPMLEAGRSLRFAILPQGRDPDDLIRAEGPGAMRAALAAALPLVDLLWRRETEDAALDTPERRAALEARLRAALGTIRDEGVRGQYQSEIRNRLFELFRAARQSRSAGRSMSDGGVRGAGRGGQRRGGVSGEWLAPAAMDTRASMLARAEAAAGSEARGRESALLLVALNHPQIAEKYEADLAELAFSGADLDLIRGALLSALSEAAARGVAAADFDVAARIARSIGADPCEALARAPHVGELKYARTGAPADLAEKGFIEVLARHRARISFSREAAEAEVEMIADVGPEVAERLEAASKLSFRDDGGVLPAEETDEESHSERLKSYIDQEIWVKRSKRRGPANH